MINLLVTSAVMSVACLLGLFYERSGSNDPKVQRNLLVFAGLLALIALAIAGGLGYVHYQDSLLAGGLCFFGLGAKYHSDRGIMFVYLAFGGMSLAAWPAMYEDVSNGQAMAGVGLAAAAAIGMWLLVLAYISHGQTPERHSYQASLDY